MCINLCVHAHILISLCCENTNGCLSFCTNVISTSEHNRPFVFQIPLGCVISCYFVMQMCLIPPKEGKRQWTIKDHKTQLYTQNRSPCLRRTVILGEAAKRSGIMHAESVACASCRQTGYRKNCCPPPPPPLPFDSSFRRQFMLSIHNGRFWKV